MAVTVTRTQIRSVLSGPAYRVQDTANAAVGMGKEIFVFNVADDTFLYVATVHDMLTYPVGKAAAVAAGQSKYRTAQVTRDFASLETSIEFAGSIRPRVKALCAAYEKAVADFAGTTTETISSAVALPS
jgi:hypothetical protein